MPRPLHNLSLFSSPKSPVDQALKLILIVLPGARFGPRAIRTASARQTSFRGFNSRRGE